MSWILILHIRRSGSLGPEEEQQLSSSLQAIPKMMWELGTRAPDTSEALLRMLLDVGRLSRAGSGLAAVLDALQVQLLPIFCTGVPARGSAASQALGGAGNAAGGSRTGGGSESAPGAAGSSEPSSGGGAAVGKEMHVLVGPLAKLPLPLQRCAVDLLAFFPKYEPQLLRTLALMCHTNLYPEVGRLSRHVKLTDSIADECCIMLSY